MHMSWNERKDCVRRDLDVDCVFPMHVGSYTSHEDQSNVVVLVRVYSGDGREWSVYVIDESFSTSDDDNSHGRPFVERHIEAVLTQVCAPFAAKSTHAQWGGPPLSDQVHSVVHAASGAIYIVCPPTPRSLHDMLVQRRHSPLVSSKPSPDSVDSAHLFTIYQLVVTMQQQHTSLPQAELSPHSFLMDEARNVFQLGVLPVLPFIHEHPASPTSTMVQSRKSMTQQWCAGEITNLEYLMAINAAAGRSIASTTAHAILPWVTDFSAPWSPTAPHLRDLSVSKFRLTKGDDHVDHMYQHTGYHIPENLSDLSVAIYLARALPRPFLQRVVRATFEPKEYPASLAKMAAASPDECIPELFLDASVLVSRHADMESLALPPWCASPDACIAYHRRILESDAVSRHLHAWIDLNFGVHLTGATAVRHKNVVHRGFVQVFQHAHPAKAITTSRRHKQASPTQVDALVMHEHYFAVKASRRHVSDDMGLRNPLHPSSHERARGAHPVSVKSFGNRYASTLAPAYSLPDRDWHFAVGCIVAELFLDRPVFSTRTIHDFTALATTFGTAFSVRKALPQLESLPPSIRRLVYDLLHPNSAMAPAALAPSTTHKHSPVSSYNAPWDRCFPSHFPVILTYLKAVTVHDWVQKTLDLLHSRQLPRGGVHLVVHAIQHMLASSTHAQTADALVQLLPTWSHLSLDLATFHQLAHTPIIALFEAVDDVAVQVCLASSMDAPEGRNGWLRAVWHHLGTKFVVTHVLPVLVNWLRTGPALLRHVTAHTLGQWARADVMGATVVSHEVLPSVLALIDLPLARLPSPAPLQFPPSGVGLALVHICAELHPSAVHSVVLPPLFRHVLRMVAAVEAAESMPSVLTSEKIDVYMTCKTIRQLVSLLPSDLAAYHIPAVLALLAVPTVGEWVVVTSLVHTVLRLGQVVGTDVTKQHLCGPLRLFLVRFPHAQFPSYMQQFQHLLGFEHFDTCLGLPWSMSTATPFKLPKVAVHVRPLNDTNLPPAMAETVAAACQHLARRRRPPPTRRTTLPHRWTTAALSWPLKGDVVHSIDMHGPVRSVAALARRWLVVSSGDGIVTAHRTTDMALLWQRPFKWPVHTIVPLSRGDGDGGPLAQYVVVCDGQSVYVLDVDANATAAPFWQWKWPAVPLVAVQVITPADLHSTGHVVVATADTVVAHAIDDLARQQFDCDGARDGRSDAPMKAAMEWKLVESGCVSCVGSLFGFVGVGSTSGHVDVLDGRTGRAQCRWQPHPHATVVFVGQVSDTTFVTVGSVDKQAIVWRWPSCHPIMYITNLPDSVQASQVSCVARGDTQWLVVGHGAKVAIQCVWPAPPTRSVKLVWHDVVPPRQTVQSIAVLRHFVAIGTNTGRVHLCV